METFSITIKLCKKITEMLEKALRFEKFKILSIVVVIVLIIERIVVILVL